MTKTNSANERLKRQYFAYLREARGRDETTIDNVAKALARFEESTGAREFRRFHRSQAVAFKKRLADGRNAKTGDRISKATMLSTLRDLRAFFFWLAHLPGFKKDLAYADADYFNLSDKDVAVARAKREKSPPTLDQVHAVLEGMPAQTIIERRDRALIAFATLTGARVAAIASFRFKHVNLLEGYVDHDARAVRTKFAKTFRTFFMPVGGPALTIFIDWISELRETQAWGDADPLFPATQMGLATDGSFTPVGLLRAGWTTTQPISGIFRKAFAAAGLPYFNPHSFRDMLVGHAMRMDLTPEGMKAWSQNLGHADVLTTFTSYGQVATHRQGELIRFAKGPDNDDLTHDPELKALLRRIQSKIG